ncbi:PAS domain S-box protein [bacterium]|nr:PAS domain S-box protein [bacterium]
MPYFLNTDELQRGVRDPDAFSPLLARLGEALQAKYLALFILNTPMENESTQTARVFSRWVSPDYSDGREIDVFRKEATLTFQPETIQILQDGIIHCLTSSETQGLLQGRSSSSSLSIAPVLSENRLLAGVLAAVDQPPERWEEIRRCRFRTFGVLTAMAMEWDITHRRLQMRERQLDALFTSDKVGVIVMDQDGNAIEVNDTAVRLSGRSRRELIGVDVDTTLEPMKWGETGGTKRLSPILPTLREGREKTGVMLSLQHAAGHRFPADAVVLPISSVERPEPVEGAVFLFIDVSKQVQSEDRFRRGLEAQLKAERQRASTMELAYRSARLSSMQVIAGALTHSINQPLNAIKVNADTALYLQKSQKVVLPDVVVKLFSDITQAADSITDIVHKTQPLWQDGERTESRGPADLNLALRNAVRLSARMLEANQIKLTVGNHDRFLPTRGDLTRLEQIILNVIHHSMLALEQNGDDDGHIRIQTDADESHSIFRLEDNRSRSRVNVSGNPTDYIAQPDDERLPLAVAKKFLEMLQGRLSLETLPSGNTGIEFRIPVMNSVASEDDENQGRSS